MTPPASPASHWDLKPEWEARTGNGTRREFMPGDLVVLVDPHVVCPVVGRFESYEDSWPLAQVQFKWMESVFLWQIKKVTEEEVALLVLGA